MVAMGIRGFGTTLDDGIFQNVKTNIAKPRPLVGMVHLDYDKASPSFQRRLDILFPSRAISELFSFFTSSYPIFSTMSLA